MSSLYHHRNFVLKHRVFLLRNWEKMREKQELLKREGDRERDASSLSIYTRWGGVIRDDGNIKSGERARLVATKPKYHINNGFSVKYRKILFILMKRISKVNFFCAIVPDVFLTQFSALQTSRSVRTRRLAAAEENTEVTRTARLAHIFKEIWDMITSYKGLFL